MESPGTCSGEDCGLTMARSFPIAPISPGDNFSLMQIIFQNSLHQRENIASEEEPYTAWSLLIRPIQKTGHTHSTPEPHLAKPRDFVLPQTSPLGFPCLCAAVFAEPSTSVPREGWGEHRLIKLYPGKYSTCTHSLPLPSTESAACSST